MRSRWPSTLAADAADRSVTWKQTPAPAEDGGTARDQATPPPSPEHIQTKLYCSLLRLQRHYGQIYASDVASASPPAPEEPRGDASAAAR